MNVFSIFQDKITHGMSENQRQSARSGRRKAFTEENFLDGSESANKENQTMNTMNRGRSADKTVSTKSKKDLNVKKKSAVFSSPAKRLGSVSNKPSNQEESIPVSLKPQQNMFSPQAKPRQREKCESPNEFDLVDAKTPKSKNSSMPLIYGSNVTMDSPDPLSLHHTGSGPQFLSPFDGSAKSPAIEQFTRPPISPWSNRAYNTPQKDGNDRIIDSSPMSNHLSFARGGNNSKSSLFVPLSPATSSSSSHDKSMPLIHGSNVIVPSPDPLSKHHEEKLSGTNDTVTCSGKMMSPIPETCEKIGGSPFGGRIIGNSGNQIVAAARRSTGIDLDSPDPLSKFNTTNGSKGSIQNAESSPMHVQDEWDTNLTSSPCINPPVSPQPASMTSPLSSYTPSPKQFDFSSKPLSVPDIRSLTVSPDVKPPSSRFRRSTERFVDILTESEPKMENRDLSLEGDGSKLQHLEEKTEEVKQCLSSALSRNTRSDDDYKEQQDRECKTTTFIDVDSREEARQSKSRVRSLQSISKSRSCSDISTESDCKWVKTKPTPPPLPHPPSMPKQEAKDMNGSMGIIAAPRCRRNIVLPGSKKGVSEECDYNESPSSSGGRSPVPPPIQTQQSIGKKTTAASPSEGLRYSPDSIAANLSPIGFEPIDRDECESHVEAQSSSSAKEVDPMELEEELLGESLLEQGEENFEQKEVFYDCDDDIDILSPYKEYDRNVIDYSDYDGCTRLSHEQHVSIPIITLNLPNKFGGEKFFRSGGRNYVYRAVLECLPERQKTPSLINKFPYWMMGKLNEIKTRMTADKRGKKSSIRTSYDSGDMIHPFETKEYEDLSEEKQFEFEVKLQGEYVERYVKRFSRDMNLMTRKDIERENRRKRRIKRSTVKTGTNACEVRMQHGDDSKDVGAQKTTSHPFLDNPPKSVFQKVSLAVQNCTHELHCTGIL